MGLGCGWYVVCLAPSSLVATTDAMVERRAYAATVAPLLILASFILHGCGEEGTVGWRTVDKRRLVWVFVFTALHVCVCRARNQHFADTERVWASILELYPSSPRPKHNLATVLVRKTPKTCGNLVRAHALLSSLVLEHDTHDTYALNNLGALYNDDSPPARESGLYRPGAAEEVLRRVVALTPHSAPPAYNLGLLYHQHAMRSRAQSQASDTGTITPRETTHREDTEKAQQETGQKRVEASTSCEEHAVPVPSVPQPPLSAPVSEEERQHLALAHDMYKQALELDDKHVLAANNLGLVLFRLSRFLEARDCYLRALLIAPQDSLVRGNLDLLLRAMPSS